MSGNGSFSLLCCSTADENKEFQKLRQKVKGGMQNSDTNIRIAKNKIKQKYT